MYSKSNQMTRAAAQKLHESIETFLCASTEKFKEKQPDMEFQFLVQSMNDRMVEIYDEDEPDAEFYGYMIELRDFFDSLIGVSDYTKPTKAFIESLVWDNFEDDEDEDEEADVKHYSLGSMYYNKLTWIVEGAEDEDLVILAKKLLEGETIQNLLDALEELAK